MLTKILGAVAAIFVVLGVVISMQPSEYRVERSKVMNAPPSVVYAAVADLGSFSEWSPWAELDPNMKTELEGRGVGATYYWNGNDDVGEGRMTITKAEPPKALDMKLEFIRPFEDKAVTGWTFEDVDGKTKATWWMDGKNNFMAKAMSLFMDFETMIGNDYDKGLAKLAPIVEADARVVEEAQAEAAAAAAAEAAAAADAAADNDEAEPAEAPSN